MTDDLIRDALHLLRDNVRVQEEFKETVWVRFIEQMDGGRATPPSPRRQRLRFGRVVPAFGVAIAVIVAAIAVPAVFRSDSAAAIVEDAAEKISSLPPFDATVVYNLDPGGEDPSLPQGSTATIEVQYGGPDRFRREIVSVDPGVPSLGGTGSFIVWDGKQVGDYRKDDNQFFVFIPHESYDPLAELSWNAPYPDWADICRRAGSDVLEDEEVAGRVARHVRCGNFRGGSWDLWIDADTGLMLKIRGELANDDYRFGTSPQGGFTVTELRYDADFPKGYFAVKPPPGAELQLPDLSLPSFHAVVRHRVREEFIAEAQAEQQKPGYEGGDGTFMEEIWHANGRWRREIVEDRRPGALREGAGTFSVWDGRRLARFDALKNTFSVDVPDPLETIVPSLTHVSVGHNSTTEWQSHLRDDCVVSGTETIAGRDARALSCEEEGYEEPLRIWLDDSTGLLLRVDLIGAGGTMVVEEITLGPKFPAGAFEFEPPAGARDIDEASADPYFTTSLRPGEPAPTWSGRALGTGDPVRLQDLRGKPALILLWADWCPLTDDACDVLGTYQSAYERWRSRIHFQVALVLSDGAAMKDIMTEGGYTFPVAVANDAAEAWGVEGLPMWVALDKRGVVVEARLALRSVSEIDEMVAKARD